MRRASLSSVVVAIPEEAIDGLLEAEAPMDPAPAVEGRAAALQARAARLRGSVITPGSLPNY